MKYTVYIFNNVSIMIHINVPFILLKLEVKQIKQTNKKNSKYRLNPLTIEESKNFMKNIWPILNSFVIFLLHT